MLKKPKPDTPDRPVTVCPPPTPQHARHTVTNYSNSILSLPVDLSVVLVCVSVQSGEAGGGASEGGVGEGCNVDGEDMEGMNEVEDYDVGSKRPRSCLHPLTFSVTAHSTQCATAVP